MEELGAGYCPWGRKESGTTERLHFNSNIAVVNSKRGHFSKFAPKAQYDEIENDDTDEIIFKNIFRSDQIRSFAQSCPTLHNPMNRSTSGLPVHHQLPEFTLTHIHQVGNAIQPSHPLSSPSPPAPNPSQHQSLFQ